MDAIKKFTNRNMSRNKRRTLVTAIGVMLSTALVCTVIGMAATFRHSIIEDYKHSVGDYHVEYGIHGNKEQYDIVKNYAHAEKSGAIHTLGFTDIRAKNLDRDFICIYAFDNDVEKQLDFKLKDGRFPENETEIVLSADYVQAAGNVRIGDELRMDLGKRTFEEDPSFFMSNDWYGDDVRYIPGEVKTYKVVGIIEDKRSFVGYNSVGYGCFTRAESFQGGYSQVFIRFDEPSKYEEYMLRINSSLSQMGGEYDYGTNTLTRYEGGLSDAAFKLVFGLGGVICLIIVGTSIFVIANSFRISVEDKKVQFGMLSSIGATRRQIRKIVLREAAWIFLVGTLAGIALGVFVVWALDAVMNYLLKDVFPVKMIFTLPWWVILVTVVLSAVTILFASLIPARLATRITPIEIIRGGSALRSDEKNLRSRKLTRKLFGVGGTIAEKNIRRDRKKYRTAVISLALGIATYIGAASFVGYGRKVVGEVYTEVDYNISINAYGDPTPERQAEIRDSFRKIRGLGAIRESTFYSTAYVKVDAEKYGTDHMKAMCDPETSLFDLTVYILPKNDFERYISKIGVTAEDPSGVAILADRELYYDAEGVRHSGRYLLTEEGENLGVSYAVASKGFTEEEVDPNVDVWEREEMQCNITRLVGDDELPIGLNGAYASDGGLFLVVSEDYFRTLPADAFLQNMFIDAEDPIEFQKGIDALQDSGAIENTHVYNAEQERQSSNRMVLVLEIFLYGFIIVIVLIGVTNVINTISTSMKIRSREFAMLRSVGMTKKEFRRMMRTEGVIYTMKSVLLGIPAGLGLSWLVYLAVRTRYDYGYILPGLPILIAVLGVGLIVGLIMWVAERKTLKQNIIETIRKQNF